MNKADYRMMAYISLILSVLFFIFTLYVDNKLLVDIPTDIENSVRLTFYFCSGFFTFVVSPALLAIGIVFWWRASKEKN